MPCSMRLVLYMVCGGLLSCEGRADMQEDEGVSTSSTRAAPEEEIVRIEPFRMERLQATHENYVDYNLSESGVHPMSVRELLGNEGGEEAFLGTELGYTQSNGSEELRDRIAAFYPDTSRDNVLVTNGGSEANYATFWSLLERG